MRIRTDCSVATRARWEVERRSVPADVVPLALWGGVVQTLSEATGGVRIHMTTVRNKRGVERWA